jgi:hypothetical protein
VFVSTGDVSIRSTIFQLISEPVPALIQTPTLVIQIPTLVEDQGNIRRAV